MFITDETGAPSSPLRQGVYLRISTRRAALVVALLLGSWLLIFNWAAKRPPVAAPTVALATTAIASVSPDGPWGELEITPITIEPPADFAARFSKADTSTWYFRDCTEQKLAELLGSAGLTDQQRDAVLKSCSADASIHGLSARPDRETVISLSPAVRSAIYQILAGDTRNAQAEPFRHCAQSSEDWFTDSGLPDDAIALARKLLYRRGGMEAFADVSAILPALPSDDDRGRLFRALSRQSALMVKLRIAPHCDIQPLIRYWGRGGREKDVGPLLESLAKVPGGFSINISQLLPRFVRPRAFTYPDPVDASIQGAFDCHWTSLNFWNNPPDDRFTSPTAVADELRTAYHVVDKASQLGDVIFFLNGQGQGIHSATFVAGDIVFTKNGANISAPWLLMKLPDLLTYYENVTPVKMMVFRKNGV